MRRPTRDTMRSMICMQVLVVAEADVGVSSSLPLRST